MEKNSYQTGINSFYYALARDAIMAYYRDHSAVRQYMSRLANKLENASAPNDIDNALDEATGAANELARRIKAETRDTFIGDAYKRLIAAVYDDMGIEH